MKPSVIFLPAGLALAFAGGLLMYKAGAQTEPNLGIDFKKEEHLVTAKMIADTEAMATKQAPAFHLTDSDGKAVDIANPKGDKPQFIYFILDGCPCSVDAEPLFHLLYANFKDKVNFVGVIDKGKDRAQTWSYEKAVKYPIVPDPNLEVIHGFDAVASAYSCLVTRQGKILKMWPGFSADMLKEMNALMSKAVGEKTRPFDPQYAPIKKRTGCAFPPK